MKYPFSSSCSLGPQTSGMLLEELVPGQYSRYREALCDPSQWNFLVFWFCGICLKQGFKQKKSLGITSPFTTQYKSNTGNTHCDVELVSIMMRWTAQGMDTVFSQSSRNSTHSLDTQSLPSKSLHFS